MTNASSDFTRKKSAAIAVATLRGWEVAAEGEWGIQFVQRRRMRKIFVLIGFILVAVWGLGTIFWLWGYFEYLCASDRIVFVSDADLIAGHLPENLDRGWN